MAARTHAPITPYIAARVATLLLGYRVSDQSMFGYARRGRIATVDVPGSNKIYFDGNAFAEWLRQRSVNPQGSHTDYDALVHEYTEQEAV